MTLEEDLGDGLPLDVNDDVPPKRVTYRPLPYWVDPDADYTPYDAGNIPDEINEEPPF